MYDSFITLKNLKKINDNDEMIRWIEDFQSNEFNIYPIKKLLFDDYLEKLWNALKIWFLLYYNILKEKDKIIILHVTDIYMLYSLFI